MDDGESELHARIEGYRILRRIGTGGIGTVFEAEQDEPRRRVALKVLRAEVASTEVLQRFEQEAQALGSLHHPGIAQIYAVGRFHGPGGMLPYIALEYVDGVPLTEHANRRSLDRRERLEMLAAVCDAVQHAHQQGVIHRDLKPANILVGDDDHPKVLDFSVSHVARGGQKDTTGLTHTGHILGTLAYMSPEQARGERAVDTRADVYALGVIGYELLAGRLPHDINELPLLDALQIIQCQPAPRLDTIDPVLRGDLTIILGKALEPERERRYASAAALADDIRRFLTDQPITARPPTITYQLSRFIRRNKSLVASALVAMVCLVGGLILALLSRREEARLRIVAEEHTEEAHRAAYAALVQAAMAYRTIGDVHSTRRRLVAADPGLRGWEWEYLSHATEDEFAHFPMRVANRPPPVASKDGTHALFAIEEGGLRLFDLAAGTWSDAPLGDLRVDSAVLLPDGHAALTSAHRSVYLFDLGGGQAPRLVFRAQGDIRQVDLLPDGRHAATVSYAGEPSPGSVVEIFDLETFAIRKRLKAVDLAYGVAFSPDGTLLAAGLRGGTVQVFDVESGESRHELKGHEIVAHLVCFSPSGRRIASVGADHKIRVWSLQSGGEELVLGPHPQIADSIAFRPDDRTLVSGHADGTIRHWNVDTGACEWISHGAAEAGREIVRTVSSPRGDTEYGIGLDGVHVRLAADPLPVVLHHADNTYPYVYDVEFSPSGRHLASAGWDGTVRIWDVATWQPVAVLDCPFSAFWSRYSPDGRRMVVCQQQGHYSHFITSWDARTLHCEYKIHVDYGDPCGLFTATGDAFLLGVVSELRVLDPKTLETRDVHPLSGNVTSLALSPDGTRIACGTDDGMCTILDARTLESVRHFRAHESVMEALAFSPDGRRLATGGRDATVRIWDATSGEELVRIDTPEGRHLFSIRFTKDGNRILTGSRYPATRVWDARSGRELLQLPGHADYVHDLEFSADGRILASASGDNTVRVWDTRPLAERVAERDRALAAERAVARHVANLFKTLGTLEKVVAAIDADRSLDPPGKHAAWNVAVRHQQGSGGQTLSPPGRD